MTRFAGVCCLSSITSVHGSRAAAARSVLQSSIGPAIADEAHGPTTLRTAIEHSTQRTHADMPVLQFIPKGSEPFLPPEGALGARAVLPQSVGLRDFSTHFAQGFADSQGMIVLR